MFWSPPELIQQLRKFETKNGSFRNYEFRLEIIQFQNTSEH